MSAPDPERCNCNAVLFEDLVNELWDGDPAQQLLARDLTETVPIDELAELLVSAGGQP